ncbi:MAG: protein translocase subunit SecF [Candidatus Moranbacteria bacterium]|nr:protein translocase subunit SecF [Candidatus Moranbacteria bacterium]
MWSLIQKRKYAYWVSGLLTVLSIVAISVWGLRLGIDFKGGTLMEVQFSDGKVPQAQDAQASLEALELRSLSIQPTGEKGMIIRYLASDEALNEKVLAELQKFDDKTELVRVDFIGASVSNQIRQDAINALITAIIGIALYIAWAFRKVSRPVSSWYYGIMANVALFHDLIITVGIFSVLGHFFGVEVGAPFIAALLTILGFSVHDTIVVYDRVRENLTRSRAKENFEDVVNRSLNETIARSFNTSFTVIVVLLAIAVYGGESIRYFALALLIGVAAGTYSSIYVASALLVTGYEWKQKIN